MAVTKSGTSQILIDLSSKQDYRFNRHLVKVYGKKLAGYPFFIHTTSEEKTFGISGFQDKNKIELLLKKENVYMVKVFYNKSSKKILLVETLSTDENDVEEHRYFAKTRFADNRDLWVEYLFTNNETLDEDNIGKVLQKAEGNQLLSQTKFVNGHLTIVKIHDNENKYLPLTPIKIKAEKIPTVDVEKGGQHVTIVTGDEVIEYQQDQFVKTKGGMATVLAGGSVGGAAVGGSIIYLISHYMS